MRVPLNQSRPHPNPTEGRFSQFCFRSWFGFEAGDRAWWTSGLGLTLASGPVPQSEIRSALSFGGFGTVGSRRVYGAPWIQGALGPAASEVGLLRLYVFSLVLVRVLQTRVSSLLGAAGKEAGCRYVKRQTMQGEPEPS